nr:hypothetical protein CFP56_12054 [Quercus suber]
MTGTGEMRKSVQNSRERSDRESRLRQREQEESEGESTSWLPEDLHQAPHVLRAELLDLGVEMRPQYGAEGGHALAQRRPVHGVLVGAAAAAAHGVQHGLEPVEPGVDFAVLGEQQVGVAEGGHAYRQQGEDVRLLDRVVHRQLADKLGAEGEEGGHGWSGGRERVRWRAACFVHLGPGGAEVVMLYVVLVATEMGERNGFEMRGI